MIITIGIILAIATVFLIGILIYKATMESLDEEYITSISSLEEDDEDYEDGYNFYD